MPPRSGQLSRDRRDHVVHLVRLAHLALAEALELLDGPGRLVLRDALDLPDATALRVVAANEAHLGKLVDRALAGDLDLLASAPRVARAVSAAARALGG